MNAQPSSVQQTSVQTSLPQPALATADDRRASLRHKVLKTAQVVYNGGHSVFNCVVLDESRHGAQIDTGGMVDLPKEITLHFSSGGTYRAQLRWVAGTRAGFEFIGPQLVNDENSKRLAKIAEVMEYQGLPAALKLLEHARFFDHADLQRAAEDADAAMRQLRAMLLGQQRPASASTSVPARA